MKISYNWLKDYVKFKETPRELAERLTESGFEVEEYYATIQPFSGVVVGKVLQVEKHPNADKLSVCSVYDGKENFQVICGAPNVARDQIVPFAQVGAELPKGFNIKKAKIRGIESFGMICSKEELGFEENSDGIWELESNYKVGSNFFDALSEEQDYIFDLAITPNRPDCLNMVGMAREVAAITGNPLQYPDFTITEFESEKIDSLINITIKDNAGCPRYAARVIRNVRIEPSPIWMQRKLESVGVRPINNIVDITNFVLMELGHPLHAFDLSQLRGPEIIVRSSRAGESFTTLDDKERKLPDNTIMICDRERAVAIGGIMGGQNSEVSPQTRDILLESAYFTPEYIAKASKKLGLSTEASQRFERGSDPNGVIPALNRAAALMSELAGGQIVTGIFDVYPEPIKPFVINFRPERVNHLLGSDLPEEDIVGTLKRLGLNFSDGKVIAPTYRVDLKKEVDLIEEVARLVTFSKLPARITTEINYENQQNSNEQFLNFIRENVISLGINEAITNSMLKKIEAEFFKEGDPITILNPISDDMTTMRPSLIPGLLKSIAFNINRNQPNIRFFEIGRIFKNYVENDLPEQPYSLCVVMTGERHPLGWNVKSEAIDFFDIKGYLEAFLNKIFLDNFQFILYDKSLYFEPDKTIEIRVGKQNIGYCGKINQQVLKSFDISKAVYSFVIDLDLAEGMVNSNKVFESIPRFPYVEKDFALVLDNGIQADNILSYIKRVAGELLKHIEIFDIYEGGNIPVGKKSLAIRMRFLSKDRTLTDQEADKIFRKIINETSAEFKGSLRE